MGYVYLAFGLSTVYLFMYKITWLFSRKTFLINISYDVVLYATAVIMMHEKIGDAKFASFLKMPLMSSIVFRLLYLAFRRIYKRDPENTFWTFTKKPIEDIVFSGLFWIFGVGLPGVLSMWI